MRGRVKTPLFSGRTVIALLGASAMIALLAPACGGRIAPGDQPPEWTDCQSADDCTLIEIGCCDHCNGGTLFAVNEAHADEALAAMKETSCPDGCTLLGCADGTPTCDGGSCGFALDGP
jgi:hypothetical protein